MGYSLPIEQPASGPPRFYKRELRSPVLRTRAIFKGKAQEDWQKRKPTGTAGQKRGIRYENQVSFWLHQRFRFGNRIEFEFDTARSRNERIIPDGLLIWDLEHEVQFIIVEIKTVHSADAFHQLELYKQVVSKWTWPGATIHTLEICGEYSPSIRLPRPVVLVDDRLDEFKSGKPIAGHPVLVLSQTRLKQLGRIGDGQP